MLRCRRAPQPPSAAECLLLTTGLSTGSWTRHPCTRTSSMRSRPSQVATMCSPCGSSHSRTRALSTLKRATSGPQPPCGSQVGCMPSAVTRAGPCGRGCSVVLGLTEKMPWAGTWIPEWASEAGRGCCRMNRCMWFAEGIPQSAIHGPGHTAVMWGATKSMTCSPHPGCPVFVPILR